MRSGNRWLIAGLAGVTLALPSIPCAAQGNAGRANSGGSATRPNSLGEATQAGPRTGTTGTGSPSGSSQQGSFQPPPPIRPGQTISVLAFPFGFTSDSETAAKPPAPGSAVAGVPDAAATGLSADQQRMSEYLTGIVKAGFLATPAYTVMTYHPQSSLVARAVKDGVVSNAQTLDIVAPATGAVDVDRARVLTNRLGIQAFLVGTMDVKTTPKSNTVEITLDTQLISSATGEVLRSAAVSGAAAGAEGVPLQTVQERAALETAQKVLPAMGIQLQAPRPAEAPAATKGKSKTSKSKASAQPKREPKAASTKSASSKDERKAQEEARKQQERQAEAARKEQARAEEKAREAQKEAKKAAEKAEREAKRQADKSRDQEKRASSSKKESVRPAVQTDNTAAAPHPSTIQTAQAAPAAPAPAPAAPAPAATAAPAGSAASAVPATVTARADASGYPVPYGYAVQATNPKLPSRDRTHLKVPAWLGVAGFLTGISFLL